MRGSTYHTCSLPYPVFITCIYYVSNHYIVVSVWLMIIQLLSNNIFLVCLGKRANFIFLTVEYVVSFHLYITNYFNFFVIWKHFFCIQAEFAKQNMFGGVMIFSLNTDDVTASCDGQTRFPLAERVKNVLQDDQLWQVEQGLNIALHLTPL